MGMNALIELLGDWDLEGKYLRSEMDAGVALVRREICSTLRDVDAVIFDCDGVLIDVRESYTASIVETVKYFMKELFGYTPPNSTPFIKVIHDFKKTGGFNNEWDIAYSLLLYLFNEASRVTPGELVKALSRMGEERPIKRLREAKKSIERKMPAWGERGCPDLDGLSDLAAEADSTGVASVERKFGEEKGVFEAVKSFLSYPGRVGESLLTTVFEEIFCGRELFEKQYGMRPQFHLGRGLIERERRITSLETLEDLASHIGGYNYGVASGRPRTLARYSLGGMLDRFNEGAVTFIESVLKEEERRWTEGFMESLKKPNPFSLLKSAEGLEPFKRAAYVGDSAEDVIMVRRALKEEERFVSVGVYSTSLYKRDLIQRFIQLETDVILPSVNELAGLLESVGDT